jgi:hypothetical protein
MISQSQSSKRVVIPVTAVDRKRLQEIKEKLGSWTAVAHTLGFRGASTARKWALGDSATFKGKDYPERIKQLHEQIVGKPVSQPAPTSSTINEQRFERVESMMETLMHALGVDLTVLESVKETLKEGVKGNGRTSRRSPSHENEPESSAAK